MAACEMGSVNLTGAGWLADVVLGLHGSYSPYHPYVAVALCLSGTLMNIVTVIVLTRPTMISPINCLLCAIAICDIIVMSSVLVFVIHFLIVAGNRCEIADWSQGWAYFLFFHSQASVIFHATSIWLTVLMAQIRVYTIKRATSAPTEVVTNRSTFYIALVTIVVVVVANIPNFLTFEIVERPSVGFYDSCIEDGQEEATTVNPFSSEDIVTASPVEETSMLYAVIASEKDCDLLKAAFWTTGILFKVVPCIMLTVSIVTLVKIIRDVSTRRKTLALVMNKKRMPRDNTTPMLVAVLSIFLVAELPQGVLHICNAIFSKATFYEQIYQPLGDVMDLLSLLNSAVNFIIYCAMSRKFRCVFLQIIFSCLPRAIHRKYLQDWSGLNENETSRRKPSAFTTDMTTKTEQLALTSSHRMSTTSMLIQTASSRDNMANVKLYTGNLLSVDQPSSRYLHTPRVSFDVPSKTPFINRNSLEIHEMQLTVPQIKKNEKAKNRRTYSERFASIRSWIETAFMNNHDSPQRRINMLQCETSTVAY